MSDDWWIDRWKIGRWSVGFLIVLFSVLGLMLYGLVQCVSGSSDAPASTTSSTSTKKIEAVVHCKELVERSLKAPSTADFPWAIEASVAGDFYTVNSYVDAQNSFGAMIRTHFTCVLKHTGAANGWALHDLTTVP